MSRGVAIYALARDAKPPRFWAGAAAGLAGAF